MRGCAVPEDKFAAGLPTIITQMDNVLATIVVAGLAGSLFGKIPVISIGTAETIRKKSTDDHSSLNFVCIATVVVGLHPSRSRSTCPTS